MIEKSKRLPIALLALRIGVFIVFFMWALDKLINPEHAASIFERYYKISGLASSVPYIIGGVQMLLLLAFILGIWKKWTYGVIFVLHLFSTLSTIPQLLNPWKAPNLLFYASIPMLAAIFALWLLRDEDTMFTIGKN